MHHRKRALYDDDRAAQQRWAYDGKPLYTYAEEKTGDVMGDSIKGVRRRAQKHP